MTADLVPYDVSDGADREREWSDLLATLEIAVENAAAMLSDDAAREDDTAPEDNIAPELAPWQPPTGIGTLPPALATRARALLQRQAQVTQLITEAVGDSRRQNRKLSALRQGEPRPPVYLDMPV